MQVSHTLRGLFTWSLRPAAPEAERHESESPSDSQLRQRCLMRLRSQGMPLWREEPESCDGCGRELLLGEQALILCRGDELLLACPLCAERLRGEGYLAVTADADRDAAEGRSLSPTG